LHPFDGRVAPLDTSLLADAVSVLKDRVSNLAFDYVLGFAEAGVLPAFLLAHLMHKPLAVSYRVRLGLPNEVSFLEPHSHISSHFIYSLKPGNTVLIVEDEITSGNTVLNALDALTQHRISVIGVCALIINGLPLRARKILESRSIPLHYIYSIGSVP
jgi:adenine phosphoribosyltransferase